MPTPPSEQAKRAGGRTDKGRAKRVALEVPVHLRENSTSFSGVTRNIGAGGVKVVLTLDLQGSAQVVEALAEVRWCRPLAGLDDQPAGVGLHFIDTPVRAAIVANALRRPSLAATVATERR
jgi:Tfp pilus assembly protein PilZ